MYIWFVGKILDTNYELHSAKKIMDVHSDTVILN